MVQKLHDFEERCVYLYTCSIEKSMNNLMEEKVNHTRNKWVFIVKSVVFFLKLNIKRFENIQSGKHKRTNRRHIFQGKHDKTVFVQGGTSSSKVGRFHGRSRGTLEESFK